MVYRVDFLEMIYSIRMNMNLNSSRARELAQVWRGTIFSCDDSILGIILSNHDLENSRSNRAAMISALKQAVDASEKKGSFRFDAE